MIDTAGTLTNAANAIKNMGAKSVYACNSPSIVRTGDRKTKGICNNRACTSSNSMPKEKRLDKMRFLSVNLFAEAMMRVHNNGSISELFDKKRKLK